MVRAKSRYVLAEINWITNNNEKDNKNKKAKFETKKAITSYEILNAIKKEIQVHYGLFGVSSVSQFLQIKYWNEKTNIFIIRVARSAAKLLNVSLLFVNSIANNPCSLLSLHFSGTIRSCQKKLFEIDSQLLRDSQAENFFSLLEGNDDDDNNNQINIINNDAKNNQLDEITKIIA